MINYRQLLCRHKWKISMFQSLNGYIGEMDYECEKCGKIQAFEPNVIERKNETRTTN